jgi:hypothetical protein
MFVLPMMLFSAIFFVTFYMFSGAVFLKVIPLCLLHSKKVCTTAEISSLAQSSSNIIPLIRDKVKVSFCHYPNTDEVIGELDIPVPLLIAS